MALALREGEIDVLARLTDGFERKEIAQGLGIALSTVNNRIYEATKRNDMRTSYQLLAWFVREAVIAQYEARERPATP